MAQPIDSKIGKNYNRIRIGINHPGNREMVNKHVLSNLKSELEVINELNIKMSENIENIGWRNIQIY